MSNFFFALPPSLCRFVPVRYLSKRFLTQHQTKTKSTNKWQQPKTKNMHLSIVFNLNTIYSILLHFYITSFATISFATFKKPFTISAWRISLSQFHTFFLLSLSSLFSSLIQNRNVYKNFGLSFCSLNFISLLLLVAVCVCVYVYAFVLC